LTGSSSLEKIGKRWKKGAFSPFPRKEKSDERGRSDREKMVTSNSTLKKHRLLTKKES